MSVSEVSFKKRKNRAAAHTRTRPSTTLQPAAAAATEETPTKSVTISDGNDDDNDNDTTTSQPSTPTTATNGSGVTSRAVEDEFEIPDDADEAEMDRQEPAWRKAAAEATMASNRITKALTEGNDDDNEDNEDNDDDNNDDNDNTSSRKRARDNDAGGGDDGTTEPDRSTTTTATSSSTTGDDTVSGGSITDGSSESERMKKFRESAKERLQKRLKKDSNPLVQSTRDRLKKGVEVVSVQSKRSAAPDKSTQEHKVAVEIEQSEKPKKKEGQAKWMGPIRVAANTRNISRFDYQPNLCKDYNETGYCSFGDACKFHHDRGDYKSGWELEKEWKAEQEVKRKRAMGEYVADEPDFRVDQEEQFPFACHICRKEFTNPIITRCKHYFCEKCALQRFAKDTKCAICNEQTHGLFSTAHKLIAWLKKRNTGNKPAATTTTDDDNQNGADNDNDAQ